MNFRKRDRPSSAEVDRRLDALRSVELFSRASDAELRPLAVALREREVTPGTEVVREGRLPTHVYVIIEGRFEVISRGDRGGEQRVVNVLGKADHFGEIGLIEGMPATATVRADGPARIAEIPGQVFLSFVDQSAALIQVADRISGWLAKTHPSYRPTAGAGGGPEGAQGRVGGLLAGWDEADVAELEAGLLRLDRLSAEERRRRLRDL